MEPKDESGGGSRRRTVLKQMAVASSGVAVGTHTFSSPAQARREWDGEREFGHIDTRWEKVSEYNGDDVYEIDMEVAWGNPYEDEYDEYYPREWGVPDTFTVYWDNNIWGFYDFVDENCYARYADEVIVNGDTFTRFEDQSAKATDLLTDDKLKYGETDGWVTEYTMPSRDYEHEDRHGREVAVCGPVYVKYGVTFQMLHQDNSSGRMFYEIARDVSGDPGGSGSISICGNAGPASICYNFEDDGNDNPVETMDSGYGWLIP